MSFKYENQGNNVYLVYTIEPDDVIDSMSLGMLTNNKIRGLAPAVFTQMDAEKYIKYNISSKVAVDQVFNGLVNKKRLLGVLSGIVNAMISAEEYMIDPSTMLMDLSYMFTDVSTSETILICLPLVDTAASAPDLSTFFKNLIFNIKFDQTENCDHVAQILNYLNGMNTFLLDDFKKLLENLSRQGGQSAAPVQPQAPAQPQPQVQVQTQQVVQSAPVQTQVPPQREVRPVAQVTTAPSQPTASASSFAIPGASAASAAPAAAAPAETKEKPMSFLYLMQHYSKENAAAYKAQQAKPAKAEKPKKEKKEKEKKGKKGASAPATGYAVPGASSFSVPGQSGASMATPAAPSRPAASSQPVVPGAAPQPTVKYQYTPPVPAAPVNAGPSQFGETTVLGGGGAGIGETTVLSAQPAQVMQPYLLRVKNNERIPLNKPVFRIGKERSYVDYFIGDNSAISRSHANVIDRDGEFCIIDTNSTNHTYVNGVMLAANQEVKLNHGDTIRLANEDFEFKRY